MEDWDLLSGIIENDPFIKFVGMKVKIVSPGVAEASLDLKENHMRTGDFMNGGAIATLLDTAGGTAVFSLCKTNQVTSNLNISYLNPVKKGLVRAVGEVIKEGKRIVYVKISLLDAEGKLCTYATGTWYVYRE